MTIEEQENLRKEVLDVLRKKLKDQDPDKDISESNIVSAVTEVLSEIIANSEKDKLIEGYFN